MPTVEINGVPVEFAATPSPADIDAVAKSLNIPPELKSAPTMMQRAGETVKQAVTDPATIAGTAAGVGAAVAGAPLLPAVAAIGGAAGLARGIQQGMQGASAQDAIKAGVGEGALQAGGEMVGRAGAAGIGKALAPLFGGAGRAVTPEAGRAATFLEPYAPKASGLQLFSKILGIRKPPILPGEATESAVVDAMQNIAEGSFFGGARIANFKRVQQTEMFERALGDVVGAFGQQADPQQVAAAFRGAIKGQLDASDLLTAPLYNTVRTEADKAGIKVNLAPLKALATERIKSMAGQTGIEAENTGVALAHRILDAPDSVSVGEAADLRSLLLTARRSVDVTNKGAAAQKMGFAKTAIKRTHAAVETALRGAGRSDLVDTWSAARTMTRETKQRLDNALIRSLVRVTDPEFTAAAGKAGRPELLAQEVFKRNNVTGIRRVREALGDTSPEFGRLQRLFVDDTVAKATVAGEGINGKALYESLLGKSGLGDAALREAVPDDAARAGLVNFAEALRVAQARPSSSTGRMFVQLAQGGAVVTALGAGAAGALGVGSDEGRQRSLQGAAVVLIAPELMARMLTNPYTARLLTQSVRMPAAAKVAGGVFGRLSAEVARAEAEHTREQSAAEMPAGDASAAGGAFVR